MGSRDLSWCTSDATKWVGALKLQALVVVGRSAVPTVDLAKSVPMSVAEGRSRLWVRGVVATAENRLGPADVLIERPHPW